MCALLAATIALIVGLTPARGDAQELSVAGRVTETESTRPLAGASVEVQGTRLRAVTDAEGRFRIAGVTGPTVSLRVTMLGYAPVVRSAPAGDQDVRILLERAAVGLEGIVVTATGEQRVREVGSSIARVRADSVAEMAPITNFAETLSGRVPGVVIQTFGGTSVGRTEVRIRGASSPSRSNAPLVYLDGVRVDTDASSTSISLNGQIPSRFNDINPDEIESIDVLKGPSASTLYGTEAANGVIVITTKSGRGAARKAQWRAWTELGRSTEPNDYPPNYGAFSAAGTACPLTSVASGACTQTEQRSFNLLEDPSTTIFRTGRRSVLGGSVAGNVGDFSHFMSGEYQSQKGVYPNDGIDKVHARGNFDVRPVPKLDIGLTSGYMSSDLVQFGEGATALGPISQAMLGQPSPTGWLSFTPQQLAQIETTQGVERFTGGVTLRLQTVDWLHLRGSLGLDGSQREDERLIPPGVFPGARAPGIRELGWNQTLQYTYEFLARSDVALTEDVKSRTSIGSQFFKERERDFFSTGTGLATGTNSIATAAQTVTNEKTTESRTVGFLGDEQLSHKDRRFISIGLRADNNSSFGGETGFVLYPKLSGSWVVSDEPFFPSGNILKSLRLRAAWGRSGRAPGATDALRFFKAFSSTVPGGTDAVSVSYDQGNLGNPRLKPELSSEVEGGFDATFLEDRVTLSLGYYTKRTNDALVFRSLGPSAGVSTGRWENLAEIRNRGLEGSLDARILERDDARLSVAVSASNNQNKAVNLGAGVTRIPVRIQEGPSSLQFHAAGYPLGGYWLRTMTSYSDANNDGIIALSEVTITDTAVYMGAPTASFQADLKPSLVLFDRLTIGGLIEIRRGNKLLNVTEASRCSRAISRSRNDPTTPLAEQARCIANILGGNGAYVEDASWTKWRELSVALAVPNGWLQGRARDATLVLAGRNLATWTPYSGVDPDVSARRFFDDFEHTDSTQPAPIRTWILRLNVNF